MKLNLGKILLFILLFAIPAQAHAQSQLYVANGILLLPDGDPRPEVVLPKLAGKYSNIVLSIAPGDHARIDSIFVLSSADTSDYGNGDYANASACRLLSWQTGTTISKITELPIEGRDLDIAFSYTILHDVSTRLKLLIYKQNGSAQYLRWYLKATRN